MQSNSKTMLLIVFLWLGTIVAGYLVLCRYSFECGEAESAPGQLPSALAQTPFSARPQLFVALHPRCPCSRATVNELARVITRTDSLGEVTVLVYRPATEPDAWIEGSLVDACRRMSCRIQPDPDGFLGASLGIHTSGGVVLYDATGILQYQGGITSSRGHEGDNIGEQALIAKMLGPRSTSPAPVGLPGSMPVFGCRIR